MSAVKKIDERLKKLVIERLDTLPANITISFGTNSAKDSYTKKDLIKNINENTEIGRKIVEMQLKYLKLLKENVLYA